METVLRGLTWKQCLIYLDDIILFSPDFPSHLTCVRQVLSRLCDANLKVKPSKTHFAQKEIPFLGHVVSEQGIQVNPAKVAAVKNFPVPTMLKKLRGFLGLCGYYRSFIKDFAKIARPMHRLQQKDMPYIWDARCQIAFDTLKQALITSPILTFPDFDQPFYVMTDACLDGLGAVLAQYRDGREHVIAYAARATNKHERNYPITELELLGVVYGVKQFDHYLRHHSFTVVTDHSSLRWLVNLKVPHGRLARWLEYLQQFDFHVQYKKGRLHCNADALSRMPFSDIVPKDNDVAVEAITRSGAQKVENDDISDAESDSDNDAPINLTPILDADQIWGFQQTDS